jgi:hypothetical protein
MKAKIQIALGLVAAVLVLIGAYQAGDFNLLKERLMTIKLLARWCGAILFKS